jgi:hypothetical protein
MLPRYAVRIEDLGRGDLVKVNCDRLPARRAADATALQRLGESPAFKVLDLKGAAPVLALPAAYARSTGR